MKLIITQPELTAIVRKHIQSTIQVREGVELVIDFTATRGEDGVTVTVDIPYSGVAGLDLSPPKSAGAAMQAHTTIRAPSRTIIQPPVPAPDGPVNPNPYEKVDLPEDTQPVDPGPVPEPTMEFKASEEAATTDSVKPKKGLFT